MASKHNDTLRKEIHQASLVIEKSNHLMEQLPRAILELQDPAIFPQMLMYFSKFEKLVKKYCVKLNICDGLYSHDIAHLPVQQQCAQFAKIIVKYLMQIKIALLIDGKMKTVDSVKYINLLLNKLNTDAEEYFLHLNK